MGNGLLVHWFGVLTGQGSMWKPWSTKMWASQSGMLEDRTRYQFIQLNHHFYNPEDCQSFLHGCAFGHTKSALLRVILFCHVNFSLQIRPLWRHYFQNTQGLIFVVDSNDRERVSEAKDELHRMLNEVKMTWNLCTTLGIFFNFFFC